MTHSALAVQSAIYDALSNAVELTSLLGGVFIFDEVQKKQKPPYIVFAEAIHSDWSTGTESGIEHAVTLNVWSDENGRKQSLEVCEAMDVALSNLPASKDGFAIVNCTHEFTEVSRDLETDYFLAKANYRVITEPLPVSPE